MRGAGVYILKGADGSALYVGQTTCLDSRLSHHMHKIFLRDQVSSIDMVAIESEIGRTVAERHLIRNLNPKYNQLHKNVPSTSELENTHFVFTPHAFYDGVKILYSLSSDDELAKFLGVTEEHICLARLRLMGESSAEASFIAQKMGKSIYDMYRHLPKSSMLRKEKSKSSPKEREFPVPCSFISMGDVL